MVLLHLAVQFPTEWQRLDAMALLSAILASALLVTITILVALLHAFASHATYNFTVNLSCMCMCMRRCKKRSKPEVITIEDSPPPTMKSCSPFKPTPTPRRRAVYRGGRRMAMHKRSSTVKYNPTIPHHCGYSCVLKLKGENTNLSR